MDPANELYDAACELLAAARHLREAAGRPGADPAVAGALGVLDTTLCELGAACREMGEASDERLGAAEPLLGHELMLARRRVAAAFEVTVDALRVAAASCDRTRGSVGPLLGELTAV